MATKKQTNEKKCRMCLRELSLERNFHKSYSEFDGDGYQSICKECLIKYVEKNIKKIDKIKQLLRIVDKPYKAETWKKAIDSDKETLGEYFRIVNLNNKYDTYVNSDDQNSKQDEYHFEEEDSRSLFNYSQSDLIKLADKWGEGYTPQDYHRLEIFFDDMKRSYEIETASHVDYLKKICKVSLKMEKSLDDDNIDHFKKLSDVYDKLMHSGKFTAVQRSAADKTGGLNTFSEFFELIEKEGFIPKFVIDEPMDIVDSTLDNLKQFTRNLIYGDPNISKMVDDYEKKKSEKGEFEDDLDDEYLDKEVDDDA